MSDFLLPYLRDCAPYQPGEQPRERGYIKLNTNENPYPPSPKVLEAINSSKARALNLYPDPGACRLRMAIAKEYGLSMENVMVGNGSDEVLGFAFLAYVDETRPVTMPEVSYGFYPIFARLFRAKPISVPLNPDFTLPVEKFCACGTMVVFANPNAPTALALSLDEVERIVASNPGHPVIVDEAYVDFGGESALALLCQYPNLLIVRTYSKSRSLAGGRLGYALGRAGMIDDLHRVKNSFNPYSINSLTLEAGIAAMEDRAYFKDCVGKVCAQRRKTTDELRALGFMVTESSTNFLWIAPPGMGGEEFCRRLKEKGILVRYFSGPALTGHVRVSIGTQEQMAGFMEATKEIMKEEQ